MAHPDRSASHPRSTDLRERAKEIAAENGFASDLPPEARDEVARIESRIEAGKSPAPDDAVRDLRALLWSSIDNRESRDLDQVEFCETTDGGGIRLRLGVADVGRFVPKGSAIDARAAAT